MINREKLLWGIILLSVGIMILLHNLQILTFHWSVILKMWPLILIIIGVNLLLPRKGRGHLVAVVFTIAAISFLGVYGLRQPAGDSFYGDQVSHAYDLHTETASLRISGGAINYTMESPTDEHLFLATSQSRLGVHRLIFWEKGSHANLDFSMGEKGSIPFNNQDRNQVKLSLHTAPTWTIALAMGAGSADFDLRQHKIDRLTIESGAAAIKATFGDPLEKSHVKVDGGAVNVRLRIPKTAACRIIVNTAFSSRQFQGFVKSSDGSFITSGFDENQPHYEIQLTGGFSKFSVDRYE